MACSLQNLVQARLRILGSTATETHSPHLQASQDDSAKPTPQSAPDALGLLMTAALTPEPSGADEEIPPQAPPGPLDPPGDSQELPVAPPGDGSRSPLARTPSAAEPLQGRKRQRKPDKSHIQGHVGSPMPRQVLHQPCTSPPEQSRVGDRVPA